MIRPTPAAAMIALVAALISLAACAPNVEPASPARTASAVPSASPVPSATSVAATPTSATFAVIGDYGSGDLNEAAVANLVASWDPAYVIAVGDDYYQPAGGTGTAKYDNSTGAYYCRWLADVTTSGTRCPSGQARTNAFFPALGNHDYSDATPAPATYLTYFRLPGAGFANSSGNERYYDFVQGNVHFFVLNSNPEEPDGISSGSVQAAWLKTQLAASTSAWNIVYDHHPPYSSDSTHGSSTALRWPFASWGADVVISGHSHTYERIMRDGIVYFVNGLGGAPRYGFNAQLDGSAVRYATDWGAQSVTVTATSLRFDFIDVAGKLIDSYTLKH